MPSFQDTTGHDASPPFSKNAVLERTQSQWLFTAEELLLTPSILDGMAVTQELANRQKGVNFITQVGIMLKLPQLTLATASVYLHRFFMRHAMVQNNRPGFHHYSVAATAIFLATKVEENYRKMKELVVACCRVAQKQPNLVVDEQSKEYWKWRDTILHNEDLLLEALCFDLQLEQPYRLLLDYLRYYDVQANKQLRNTSWAFLNDSLVTTMCLQLTPSAIAGSALYMGVKNAGISLPDDEKAGRDVYENPTLPRQGQKDAYTKDDDLALFDRTRQPATPQPDLSPIDSAKSGSQGAKRDRDVTDDPNSGEWGSGMPSQRPIGEEQSAPSPKRLRRDSRDDNINLPQRMTNRPPATMSDDRPSNDSRAAGDDVQRRIDEIVNASSGRAPQSNQHRRPSVQNSHQSNSRRHSSGGSNWNGPLSSYSNGHAEQAPSQHRPESRDNGMYTEPESGDHGRMPSRVPLVYPADERPPQPPQPEPPLNGINDLDDAEKVDYGSEEGEL
ncbi:Cyclin, domain-containing protein [Cladophialophora immunda]|nr:Cyclin, domain-containing protein [Cladophialophora immunda]